MKYRTFIAFLSLLVLSGCGVFTKKTTEIQEVNNMPEEEVESLDSAKPDGGESSSSDAEVKVSSDLQSQIKLDKKRLIQTNNIISSGDKKQCAKLQDQNARLECEDQVLLQEIGKSMKASKCKELNSKDLQEICKMGFNN